MGSLPLPALHVQPPEDPTVGLQRAIQLKSLLNQQALMPGQLQQQQQQIQATGLENQQRQQSLNDQKAMTAAMQEWDGKSIDDLSGLVVKHGASATAVMGLKSSILKQKQDLANLDKDQLANEAARSDQLLGHLDAIKGETDPVKRSQVATSQAGQILSAGLVKDPQTTQMVQAIASGQRVPDDNELSLMEKGLRSHSALIADTQKQAEGAKAGAEAQKTQVEADFLKKYGGMSPQMAEARYLFVQQRKSQGLPVEAEDSAFAKGYEHMKTLVPVANINLQAGLLSTQAKDMAAQLYSQTGQLPAGMRSPAMSAGILNTAAGAQGGAPNIAANKASYQADTHSLANLQKQFDQVTAFENTAGKNLDVFLKTAKDVVDSGSPLINKPLRSLSNSLVGSENQAAFNAARTTALTEIAKVLNSSNASGVLSDSARHEVEGLIGPGATLKQIYQAANVLKQDMANRHQAYQDQINDIKGRTGGSQLKGSTGPKAGDIEDGYRFKGGDASKPENWEQVRK